MLSRSDEWKTYRNVEINIESASSQQSISSILIYILNVRNQSNLPKSREVGQGVLHPVVTQITNPEEEKEQEQAVLLRGILTSTGNYGCIFLIVLRKTTKSI